MAAGTTADTHVAAQRYLHQALRFAKASGDRAFGAYIVALLVNQSPGLETCGRGEVRPVVLGDDGSRVELVLGYGSPQAPRDGNWPGAFVGDIVGGAETEERFRATPGVPTTLTCQQQNVAGLLAVS